MRTGTILFAQEGEPKVVDKAEKKEDPPAIMQFLPFIMVAVMAYLLLIAPNRRERQRQQQLLNGLKKNDEVVTNAGILGIVTNIKDEEVTIKSDDTKLRILKSSIARIVNVKETPAAAASADTGIQPAK